MLKFEIGQQLKEIRHQSGWSLSLAAEKTGVSKAMLGQIERNESSPTIATLWKIATGFHKPLSLFVNHSLTEKNDEKVHKNSLSFTAKENDLEAKVLFPFDPRFGFEMFLIKLHSEQTHISEAHDEGVFEHIIVVSGEMEVSLKGRWKKISTGDVLRFAANQAHGYRNLNKEIDAEFHNIIYYS